MRHAKTIVDLNRPSTEWSLAPGFEKDLEPLIGRLQRSSPLMVWSSPESKALKCAEFLAEALKLPVRKKSGLAEHRRGNAPRPDSRAEFEALMAEFFRCPDKPVFGTETASAALARFAAAMEEIRSSASGSAIIVTHGTVLSLFLEQQKLGAAFDIWMQLEMPDLIELAHFPGGAVEPDTLKPSVHQSSGPADRDPDVAPPWRPASRAPRAGA